MLNALKLIIPIFVAFGFQSAQALTEGCFESENAATPNLTLHAWGQGFTVEGCARYGAIGCLPFKAAVFQEGAKWSGDGTLTIRYMGNMGSFECPYSMSATLSEGQAGEIYLALWIPRSMYQQANRCPTDAEVGGNEWHFLSQPFTAVPGTFFATQRRN